MSAPNGPENKPVAHPPPSAFPLRIPPAWKKAHDSGTLHPALARQVDLDPRESADVPGFLTDPVGDHQAHQGDGLLQKYRGRALWVVTGVCAGHCRYCFRRHFPYDGPGGFDGRHVRVLEKLRRDPSIREVILSGGDPLMLPQGVLEMVVDGLSSLAHVHTLRLHTRVPIFQPGRLENALWGILDRFPRRKVVVLHTNHPAEWGPEQGAWAHLAQKAGVSLLNQSVLLAGVNDDAQVLADLSQGIWQDGVLPYYLHFLDPVQGAAHFAVSEGRAETLLSELRGLLPGYLVPRLVWEKPGAPSKMPLPKGSC